MKARVYVTLKPGVLDPQGQAVGRTLARLGFDEVAGVRIGKYVEIELADELFTERGDSDPARTTAEARARVEEMCQKLIANTVIEDFRVEVD
jgi:phosphoribosylformylglycinamidine synthase